MLFSLFLCIALNIFLLLFAAPSPQCVPASATDAAAAADDDDD